MSFNTQVMELLKEKVMSTNEIHRNLGMSINYVRTQLRLMESAGLIERQDERVPVIYKLSPNNPAVRYAESIAETEKKLLMEDSNKLRTMIRALPKEQWPMVAEELVIHAEAIKSLADKGMLVDTL